MIALVWMVYASGIGILEPSLLTRQFSSYQECRAAIKAANASPSFKRGPGLSLTCLTPEERYR